MENRFNRLGNRRVAWGPLLCLLTVVAFLVHDAGMTSVANASAPSRTADERQHSHADGAPDPHSSVPATGGDSNAGRATRPHSDHGDCGVASDVVPVSEGGRHAFASSAGAAGVLTGLEAGRNGRCRMAREATHPPSVRRALLQVYRI